MLKIILPSKTKTKCPNETLACRRGFRKKWWPFSDNTRGHRKTEHGICSLLNSAIAYSASRLLIPKLGNFLNSKKYIYLLLRSDRFSWNGKTSLDPRLSHFLIWTMTTENVIVQRGKYSGGYLYLFVANFRQTIDILLYNSIN